MVGRAAGPDLRSCVARWPVGAARLLCAFDAAAGGGGAAPGQRRGGAGACRLRSLLRLLLFLLLLLLLTLPLPVLLLLPGSPAPGVTDAPVERQGRPGDGSPGRGDGAAEAQEQLRHEVVVPRGELHPILLGGGRHVLVPSLAYTHTLSIEGKIEERGGREGEMGSLGAVCEKSTHWMRTHNGGGCWCVVPSMN